MIIRKAEHVISAVKPEQYPRTGYPEVALAGRSNVGKSSVINALVNRKGLARVGSTPGKTRIINFYNVNDSIMIVDLPGYGYAKVSKEEKKAWGKLADTYLTTRQGLKAILLVIDIRHPPSEDDLIMLRFIRESGKRLIVLANKSDKIKRAQLRPRLDQISEDLGLADVGDIIPFSGIKKTGVAELWKRLGDLLGNSRQDGETNMRHI